MLYKLVERKKQEWLKSADFPLEDIFSYIRKTGKLRKPQIEALETYLFLKTQGDNRPLPELLGSGFFTTEKDFEELAGAEIPPNLYELLKKDTAAMGLYQFAMLNDLQDLQKEMHRNHGQIHFQEVINKLFYEISYADYLMSLPMGAGKTFLIAAIIYLDLYFYNSNPDGNFARNFLVLIPNALKSSIGPSLRNIENFDPTWVLPKEVVAKLQPNLRFEVLDKKKQSKNSMRTNNPNAQKVMHAVHSGFNHVFIVNAEKVILDNYDESRQELPEVNDGVKYERANELRSVLSQLPNLGIFVDEVHHVHTSGNTKEKKEIKLRGVINRWNQEKNHNISYMLGFSGTPYLPQTNSVKISEDLTYKIKNITSTVYHYPLFNAIEGFLKLPEIKTGFNTNRNAETELKRKEIIKFGVDDFLAKFGDKKYAAGAIAKMAIYCPSIEVLEEEVYPLLTNKLKIPSQEILRYHKGNKTYTLPLENERHFRSLDMPESPHRFILLVQVGREGWDCRSLTGVILSQEGDCSRNMVLQTCCRCLREVDGGEEKAVIWLSEKNARYLGEQLEKEQDTSIGDISRAQRHGSDKLDTTSRIKYLGNVQRDRLKQAGGNFRVMDVKDGIRLVQNPIHSMNQIRKLIKDIKEPDGEIGKFWFGYINDGKLGRVPVYVPNLTDHTQKVFDVNIMNKILHEELPKLVDSELVKKTIIYYIDIAEQQRLNQFIEDNNNIGMKFEWRDLKALLDDMILPDEFECQVQDLGKDKQKNKDIVINITRMFSDSLIRQIDAYNQKRSINNSKAKTLTISDAGLELIEMIAIDWTKGKGAWHSDYEVKIQEDCTLVVNGKKTKDVWNGKLVVSADLLGEIKHPKRIRIRSISGEETIKDL